MNKLIVGNLKMNILSQTERERYLNSLQKELVGKKINNCEIIICPPFVHLEGFRKAKIKKIILGAQNMFWEAKGSFTGEVSPAMLKDFGCEYVILGHSERRRYFCERDEEINLKIISALKNNLKPIICVGESKQEKEDNQTLSVISQQVKSALEKVSRTKAENLVIAYEPIWSVGTDEVPKENEIMEARVLIFKILTGLFGVKYAQKVKIIYGGSVSVFTVKQVCLDPGMDGALIGRESLTPYEFVKIAEIINDK
ncbi:MAG: triose-phosphate isomerase [Candidatus Moranbacteria bacterium RIFOXYA12_FULL_35_19]|nr:MAG: Triosephosphate isomerase [Candidatus Moranbacteria bacterium GW2011_GWF2_35_39]OGI32832.1 MAG: triose-phosphate isomerase [Candidatus Moranbacteria bacterium RIFOXYC12_FULL_36_13]OGI36160.1 MAG: triose-phosphate isomerase [Candidatus Moranbacteria bacterium RIFOXYA12_FULL_35_19]